jgi:transcription elongation factor Elf1
VTEVKFPFSCPICGRKTEYPLTELVEGAVLTCSFCKLSLTLHGHMLEDVHKEIKKLKTSVVRKSSSKERM